VSILEVPQWDGLTPYLDFEDKVALMAWTLSKLPQAPTPVQEIHENGFYLRVMTIPKGAIFVGRKHLLGHEVTLTKGSCIHIQPDGQKYFIKAPFTMMSKPGFYVVCYALEDLVAFTAHAEGVTEADAFESAEVMLERGKAIAARLDYQKLLCEHKLSDPYIRRAIEAGPTIHWYGNWYVWKSNVEGQGVFVDRDFQAGETIGPARWMEKRTPLGRYTNHSPEPNAEMVVKEEHIYLRTLVAIKKHTEVFIDYRTIAGFNPQLVEALCQVQLQLQ
jgi:hypothetical protein